MAHSNTVNPRLGPPGPAPDRRGWAEKKLVPIGIVVVSAVVAAMIVRNHTSHTAELGERVRAENKLKMASLREHVEEYLDGVYSILLYVALDDEVVAMSNGSREHVQAVFDHQWDRHRLSELYVIERDFDGTGRPLMTFEKGSEQHSAEHIHTLEREQHEYRPQMEHIRRFAADPTLKALLSEEIPLCLDGPDGQPDRGVVYSAPVRSGSELVGIVAAMIPTRRIEKELEQGHYGQASILMSERGVMLGCKFLSDDTRERLEGQLRHKGVAAFFYQAPETFQVGKWTTVWTPVEVISEQRWWLAFQYDESVYLGGAGFGEFLSGWGGAGIIVALGVALAALVRATQRPLTEEMHHRRELRRAEQEARRQSDFLRSATEALTHPFYVIDANDYTVKLANSAAGLGVLTEESTCYALTHGRSRPCDGSGVECPLARVKATKESAVVEHVHSDVDGRQRIVEVHGFPIIGPDGSVTQMIEYCLDITERRRAEEARLDSERRYRGLFEESRDAVFVSTPQGRLLDINQAGVEMLGYESKEELLEVNIPRDLYFDPEERGKMQDLLARQGFGKDLELRLKRRDGREIAVLETATAVKDEAGEVVAYHGIMRDITEQRALEEQLRQAQKMEAVGTLAGGIAHDFNNHLTAILGNVDLARTALDADHPSLAALGNIETAARQAGAVAESLLTFSHRTPTRESPAELAKVVSESTRLLGRVLPASIELVEDVPTGPALWVHANATQLQQVVMNLAINARDAMPQGGQLRVTLRAESLGESGHNPPNERHDAPGATLVVEDNGTGMSEETRSRVFEPFFTTKPRGKGTGLGMSVIYGIVARHHGHIRVDSWPSSGTRVIIWLPTCAPADEPAADRPEMARPAGHGELVILAEDDRQVRAILVSALRSSGFQVVPSIDGLATMVAVNAHRRRIRLIILDLDLPKKHGLACLQEIRHMGLGVPVILMSGSTAFDEEPALGEHDHLLRKPFRMSELVELASEVLETAQFVRDP